MKSEATARQATTSRKYRVTPVGSRGIMVVVRGAYSTDQAWRDAAAVVTGVDVDTSFDAERVVRLFPWWVR